jgi:hypothetical protein
LEDLGPDYTTLVGKVTEDTRPSNGTDRWATLTGLFAELRYDSEISVEGNFFFDNVLAGQYLLTIRERTTVISASVVSIQGRGQQDIVVDLHRSAKPSRIN